jgi:carbonic anhydrase/acetyltransferase-like protein (isoleucine patch superfamily)
MVMGSPGKVVRTLDTKQGAAIRMGAEHYVQNAKRFRDQLVIQETADPTK